MQAGTYDSKVWSLAGDSHGIIHAFDPSPISDFLSVPEHNFQHSSSREYQLDSHVGAYESSLHSSFLTTHRSLPFVPQVLDGCEFTTLLVLLAPRFTVLQCDFILPLDPHP